MNITQPLHDHHKYCDDLFATAEAAAHDKRWADCAPIFGRLRGELEAHFATEEEVLFPAFEAASGVVSGPTQVMRFEHVQMRELLGQMADAVDARSAPRFSGAAETLLVLMQQHNMKEEHILYPMCDRSLAGQGLHVDEGLRARREAACPA